MTPAELDAFEKLILAVGVKAALVLVVTLGGAMWRLIVWHRGDVAKRLDERFAPLERAVTNTATEAARQAAAAWAAVDTLRARLESAERDLAARAAEAGERHENVRRVLDGIARELATVETRVSDAAAGIANLRGRLDGRP